MFFLPVVPALSVLRSFRSYRARAIGCFEVISRIWIVFAVERPLQTASYTPASNSTALHATKASRCMWATDSIAGLLCTDSMLLVFLGLRSRRALRELGSTGLPKRESRYEILLESSEDACAFRL